MGFLQAQADHYQKTIDETKEIREKVPFGDKVTYNKLTERIGGLERAKSQTEEQEKVEETYLQQKEDIRLLEKFKKWSKENLLGLSAIAITIAGLITTVIVGTRSAVVKGAKGTANVSKGTYKFFKDLTKKLGPVLGPVIGAIGNLLVTMLKYGCKGLEWLSKNLWAIVVMIVVYIINANKNSRKK